eukprot:6185954-Pleurochrysis_carterae.AAC.1
MDFRAPSDILRALSDILRAFRWSSRAGERHCCLARSSVTLAPSAGCACDGSGGDSGVSGGGGGGGHGYAGPGGGVGPGGCSLSER